MGIFFGFVTIFGQLKQNAAFNIHVPGQINHRIDCTHSARIALISLEYTTFEINTKSTHIIKHIFKVIIANPFCVKISVGQKQFEKQLLPTRKPNGETLRCVCVCVFGHVIVFDSSISISICCIQL